jgi:hypothetical protein
VHQHAGGNSVYLSRYAPSIGGVERAAETIAPLLPKLCIRELKRLLDTLGALGAQREAVTALFFASEYGKLDIVRILIERGSRTSY